MCFVSSHYITNEPPSGGRGVGGRDSKADRKRQTKKKSEKRRGEDKGGGRETETSLGTFSFFSPQYPFPNTSESNWTKTVI